MNDLQTTTPGDADGARAGRAGTKGRAMTRPADRPQQAQPSGPASTDRTFLYQFFRQAEAADTWTADVACPADSPIPYTLTAKAENLLEEAGATANPTTPLRNTHSCGMGTRPPQARPGLSGPPAYITEISLPPRDSGIHRLHGHMLEPEPEPEPEAGL